MTDLKNNIFEFFFFVFVSFVSYSESEYLRKCPINTQMIFWLRLLLHQVPIKINIRNLLILSTAAANFCSSSGQISGQWVKPKYINVHFPKKFFSVTCFPSWLMRLNGPPMAAFPTEGPSFTAFEALLISAVITPNQFVQN